MACCTCHPDPMDDGAAANDPQPLPAEQTWPIARRRFYVTFAIAGSAVAAAGLVFAVVTYEEWSDLLLASSFALQLALFGGLAWNSAQPGLRADATGLHGLAGWSRETYPWETISEIRPSILKGRRTYLVAVRDGLPTVDLPLTEEHLGELQRWHRAATDAAR